MIPQSPHGEHRGAEARDFSARGRLVGMGGVLMAAFMVIELSPTTLVLRADGRRMSAAWRGEGAMG